MAELVVIGLVAGFLAGISPCIIPVLPVVLVAGSTAPTDSGPSGDAAPGAGSGTPAPVGQRMRRPVAVVVGLVLSFSLLVLAGSELLSLLHLPQDTLRDVGIGMLLIVGVGYLVPPVASLIERPFARIGTRQPARGTTGFVLGLALGLLFVPCAGPVLAAITVVGATHRVGVAAVLLTVAFGVGVAVPLLAVALAGEEVTRRVGAIRSHAPAVRRIGGVVLIVMAVAIASDLFDGLQRDVPAYSDALQGTSSLRHELSTLTGNGGSSLASCNDNASGLVDCGHAPNFTGITAWLNTPGGRPLSLSALRGKVVLVDFWTYSCINCQRTLPHVEAWYQRYRRDGFVVVGVHTPEFAFEHVVSNVRAQAATLGVRYPVAVDDEDKTWDAYDNEYWPADYLIDASGVVRHVHFGEGSYSETERLIRQLLRADHPGITLPPPTKVANLTPTGELSPETYVGYDRLQYLEPPSSVVENQPASYQIPATLPLGTFGLSGTWTEHSQEATADGHASLELRFLAKDVYLVLGGSGTLSVLATGHAETTIQVHGVPRLYSLYRAPTAAAGTLVLEVSKGVQAYDFTFG
jgi:cytochrome c biogenesis protein CcdA/thiol-disulfide isomerase/thioredoxin